jgi:integrase
LISSTSVLARYDRLIRNTPELNARCFRNASDLGRFSSELPAMPKLTKRIVDGAVAKDSETFVWDGALPGFGLRVHPSGRKTYFVQYRSKGRTRRLAIGTHGVLTPSQARDLAATRLAEVRAGRDPSKERKIASREPTVSELADRFMKEHVAVKTKATTATSYEIALRVHILPRLGRTRVGDVTRPEIAALHHELRATPIQANRCLAVVSKMFNLAECWGLRADGTNPTRHVQRYAERRRERFLCDRELARLGDVLRSVEQEGIELPSIAPLIRMLVFTGARKTNIVELRWDEVDSKTGRIRIPLNAPALSVLSERDRDGEYVFPGARGDAPLRGLTRSWYRIRQRAELEGVRLHDLRHSFASVGAGAGASLHILGRLLGHTQPATTNRYAHLQDDPVRQASELIGSRISALMQGDLHGEIHRLESAWDNRKSNTSQKVHEAARS